MNLPPVPPAPPRPARRPYPKRPKGSPLIHRETLRAGLPWIAGALAILVFIGVVSQSLISVALEGAAFLVVGFFAARWKERQLREFDREVASVLTEGELYVPEDWQ